MTPMTSRCFVAVLIMLVSSVVNAQWQLLPGLASDIGVGARGAVWVTGVDRVEGGHSVYRWTSTDWQIATGGAERIDVDPQGTPWVVNSAGNILRLVRGAWEVLPGLARDIGIGANGSVWAIGVTPVAGGYTIHRWNGSNWDLVPGGAVRIDVDPRGNPWVVNDRGEIFRRNPNGSWQQIPGSATAVTIANDGTVWLLSTEQAEGGYAILRRSGNGWRRVDGGAVALSAGAVPWLVNAEGRIYVWTGRR